MQSDIELIVIRNPLAFVTDERQCEILTGDVLFELVEQVYPLGLPDNAYLYHDKLHINNDVTPQVPSDIDELNELNGSFYLVTYPLAGLALTAMIWSAAIPAIMAFLMPMPEFDMGKTGTQAPSPNNSLANRQNRQRLGGRIPDIYGLEESMPDKLTDDYSVFVDNQEVEFSWFALGRGRYEIQKVLDDVSIFSQINGSTAEFYLPNKSFVYDEPYHKVGNTYSDREAELSGYYAKRYSSIQGQVLPPPDNFIIGKDNIRAVSPNKIEVDNKKYNLKNLFAVGDTVSISNAENLGSANNLTVTDEGGNQIAVTYSLNGDYEILELTENSITLKNPEAINTDWAKLNNNIDITTASDMTLSTESQNLWTDWIYIEAGQFTNAMFNIVAPNGIYTSVGAEHSPADVRFACESELVNDNDEPIIDTYDYSEMVIYGRGADKYINEDKSSYTFSSDDNIRRTAGGTYFVNNPHQTIDSRLRVRWRRIKRKLRIKGQNNSDEIRIRDFYGISRIQANSNPNLTHVYVKQRATEQALRVKQRKFKVHCQRLVKKWNDNNQLVASKRIDDIIYNIATDPACSNLTIDDLDMEQITTEVNKQIAYFGTPLVAEFGHTFDDKNVTTEEMIAIVAQAGFFKAYRMNNKIHLHFEQSVSAPVANFNSHNMLPDTFEHSEVFGAINDFDGVEVTYKDIKDGQKTLRYPLSTSNPQKVELIGVRNKVQAHLHMMRQHWKNQYAQQTCSFTGADETGVVIPSNVIRVANQTNADVQQGSVESLDLVDGSPVLSLSEPVDFKGSDSATIFVQTIARTVDNIKCYATDDPYTVRLLRQPSQPISIGYDAVVQATYSFVTHDDTERDMYIVSSKSVGENALSHALECVKYDSRFYQNDSDFKTNKISL